MKTILKYLSQFKFMIIAIVLMIAIQALGELYMPNLMSDIIDNGISKVEYTVDDIALKNAIITEQIPELNIMLEQKGISKDIFISNNENVLLSLKESFMPSEKSDMTSMDTETYALFQKMLTIGIIKAENVSDMKYIKEIGAKMIALAFVIAVVTIIASFLSSKISMGYGKVLRQKIFEKVSTFSQGDINKFGTPSLITRTTNDVTQIQNATVMALRMMVMVPIMSIGSIFMALSKDRALTWVLAVAVPIVFVVLARVM